MPQHIITYGCHSSDNTSLMSGYSIIEAHSMATALTSLKTCPFLEIDVSLDVPEIMK